MSIIVESLGSNNEKKKNYRKRGSKDSDVLY
jgi:hypothetical protein